MVDSAAETGNPPGNPEWQEGVLLAAWAGPVCDSSPPSLAAGRLKASSHCQGKSWPGFLDHQSSAPQSQSPARQIQGPPLPSLQTSCPPAGNQTAAPWSFRSAAQKGKEKERHPAMYMAWHRKADCSRTTSELLGPELTVISVVLSCEASSTAQDVMASNAATYRQPTSSHYIFQTPPSCAPTSLAVARAQRLHHGSRSKRTSRSPRHIDARKVHSRGPPRKPFQARRCSPGPMAAFEGAALACSASAGRCMSQDWSRLDEDDLTLQLLRRWHSRTEDAPARVQGSTRPGRGSGRCRWRMRTTPASRTGICSVVMASSVKNSRFSKGASNDRIA